jgi:hypothetical protein
MEEKEKLPRLSNERKADLVQRWKESGKSKKVFAQEQGLNYYTFITWCDREKKNLHTNNNTGFSQVRLTHQSDAFACVELSSGMRLKFYEPMPAEYFQSLLGIK